MSKLWASTLLWALAMARVTSRCSIGSPSSMPSRVMRPWMRSAPKMRRRSSSRERKNREAPGSPGVPPSAKLIVDAPALVTFRADDEEPAGFHDLLVFRTAEVLVPAQHLIVRPRISRGAFSICSRTSWMASVYLRRCASYSRRATATASSKGLRCPAYSSSASR